MPSQDKVWTQTLTLTFVNFATNWGLQNFSSLKVWEHIDSFPFPLFILCLLFVRVFILQWSHLNIMGNVALQIPCPKKHDQNIWLQPKSQILHGFIILNGDGSWQNVQHVIKCDSGVSCLYIKRKYLVSIGCSVGIKGKKHINLPSCQCEAYQKFLCKKIRKGLALAATRGNTEMVHTSSKTANIQRFSRSSQKNKKNKQFNALDHAINLATRNTHVSLWDNAVIVISENDICPLFLLWSIGWKINSW